MHYLTSLEICAGGGGQALGLEQAGFHPVVLVENDRYACATLRANRPEWNVIEKDVREFSALTYRGRVDLLAGGVPCPPFSLAGKQLGADDERDLFPTALRLVAEAQPRAVMLENVRGIFSKSFDDYRNRILAELREMGYAPEWRLLNASDYGVPQLRPRAVLVAIRNDVEQQFVWPAGTGQPSPTVGETLLDAMSSGGWQGAIEWKDRANGIAPTIVGGSKKHGGPDLGPTRAKQAWAALGVNGHILAKDPPAPEFEGTPSLTVKMVAALQGFPPDWNIEGSKTTAYRQVGNAFPPPVARAVGVQIYRALSASLKPHVLVSKNGCKVAGKTKREYESNPEQRQQAGASA